jgi:hypothetical protein
VTSRVNRCHARPIRTVQAAAEKAAARLAARPSTNDNALEACDQYRQNKAHVCFIVYPEPVHDVCESVPPVKRYRHSQQLIPATALIGFDRAWIVSCFYRIGLSDVPASQAGAGSAMFAAVQQVWFGLGPTVLGGIFSYALRVR